jgi:hypothetical protein
MGRENSLNADHSMSEICLVKTHVSFNVSGTCHGQKQLLCMSGLDRTRVSVKYSHVLKKIIFEKKRLLFLKIGTFLSTYGVLA